MKRRSTYLKNWLKFTYTLKSMHNDVDTHIKRDKEWKNIMITLKNMP